MNATITLSQLAAATLRLPRLNSASVHKPWTEAERQNRTDVRAALTMLSRLGTLEGARVIACPEKGIGMEEDGIPPNRWMRLGKWLRRYKWLLVEYPVHNYEEGRGETYRELEARLKERDGGAFPADVPVDDVAQWMGQALTLFKTGGENMDVRVLRGTEAVELGYGSYPHLWAADKIPGLSSCMSGTKSEYMNSLLTLNADKVGVLAVFTPEVEDRPVGRALVWTLHDGSIFVDREYVETGAPWTKAAEQAITRWIHEQKDAGEDVERRGAGGRAPGGMKVLIRDGEAPYLDTFPTADVIEHGDHRRPYLLELCSGHYGEVNLQQTNGNLDLSGVECESCGDRMDEEDARYGPDGCGPYCDSCFDEQYVYVEYRHPQTGRYICDYAHIDDVTHAEDVDEYRLSEHVEMATDGRYAGLFIAEENARELHGGGVAHCDEDDLIFCEDVQAYVVHDDAILATDGQYADEWILREDAEETDSGHVWHYDDDLVECAATGEVVSRKDATLGSDGHYYADADDMPEGVRLAVNDPAQLSLPLDERAAQDALVMDIVRLVMA